MIGNDWKKVIPYVGMGATTLLLTGVGLATGNAAITPLQVAATLVVASGEVGGLYALYKGGKALYNFATKSKGNNGGKVYTVDPLGDLGPDFIPENEKREKVFNVSFDQEEMQLEKDEVAELLKETEKDFGKSEVVSEGRYNLRNRNK